MPIYKNNLVSLAWAHDIDNIFKYFNNYFEVIENYKEKYKVNLNAIMGISDDEKTKMSENADIILCAAKAGSEALLKKHFSSAKNLNYARKKTISNIKKINWTDGFFRKDIGWRVIKNK